MKDFLLQRGKYKDLSRAFFLFVPFLVYATIIMRIILNSRLDGPYFYLNFFYILPVFLSFIAYWKFPHQLIDKIIFYILFIVSLPFALLSFISDIPPGSLAVAMLVGNYINFMAFIFMIWFIVRFLIYIRSSGIFSRLSFPKKLGISFVVLSIPWVGFLLIALFGCTGDCLGLALLGLASGLYFTYFILHFLVSSILSSPIDVRSGLGRALFYLSGAILLVIYYFIGYLIGKLIYWIYKKHRNRTSQY